MLGVKVDVAKQVVAEAKVLVGGDSFVVFGPPAFVSEGE